MTRHIETLMRNSASTFNGWTKTTTPENEQFRSIRIGSQKSCNDDGLICDITTPIKIKDLLLKLNINEFQLKNIHTEYVYATEVRLKEDRYIELTNKLSCVN